MSTGKGAGLVQKVIKGLSRLSGFAATSLISGAVNVATIPLVVAALGAHQWAAIAAGQAVGVIGSIFIQLGWGVTGPAEIAATLDDQKRRHIYRESLYYRFAISPPVLIGVGIASWFVVPDSYSLVSSLAGVGSALMGLTASWYFVGKGAPVSLLRLDTLPRVGSIAGGALLLTLFPSGIIFASAIILSSLLPLLLASASIRTKRMLPLAEPVDFSWPRGRMIFSYQLPGIVSSVVSQSYKLLPLILISTFRPDQAAAYALIDRIVKFAVAAIKPVAQSLQSWVPAAGEEGLRNRIWGAMTLAAIAGGCSSVLFTIMGPYISRFLGADAIELSDTFFVPAALTLGFSALTQTGMLSLLALGQRKSVAVSVSIGGFIGLASLIPAVTRFGAVGGLYSLVLAEVAVLCLQLGMLLRGHRVLTRRHGIQECDGIARSSDQS